jgi:hypothetical protein
MLSETDMADEERANSLAAFAYKHASFIIAVLAGLVIFLAVTSREVSAKKTTSPATTAKMKLACL